MAIVAVSPDCQLITVTRLTSKRVGFGGATAEAGLDRSGGQDVRWLGWSLAGQSFTFLNNGLHLIGKNSHPNPEMTLNTSSVMLLIKT